MPGSHNLDYKHDTESDYYKFDNVNQSDCIDINLRVGEFFMAPQRLVHSGGSSDDKVIRLEEKSLDLNYTHVSLHVDFYLTESIHLPSEVQDTTCYVSFDSNDN